jgi:metal-responsive CopG/Arc/MetJ family transcriptional regulator
VKIKIEVDIPDELLAEINEIIKELGISLNESVEKVLTEAVERYTQNKSKNLK